MVYVIAKGIYIYIACAGGEKWVARIDYIAGGEDSAAWPVSKIRRQHAE